MIYLTTRNDVEGFSTTNRNTNTNTNTNTNKIPSSPVRSKIASSIAKGERRAKERNYQSRPICSNCYRPPSICVCKSLPSQKIHTNNTFLLILQHPNEFRKKNFSTVPLMKLVLDQMMIKVGYSFDYEKDIISSLFNTRESSSSLQLLPSFVKEIIENGQKPLLLYPGKDAICLGEEESCSNDEKDVNGNKEQKQQQQKQQQQLNDKNILIVIDGTWSEARRIIRDSPTIVQNCQQIQFTTTSSATNKRIYDAVRKEPEKHCLSTLEACAQTIQLLEPTNYEAKRAKVYLNRVLQTHVDSHLVNGIRHNTPREESSKEALYLRNKRRREIEKDLFEKDHNNSNTTDDDAATTTTTIQSSSTTTATRTTTTTTAIEQPTNSILPDGSKLRLLKVSDVSTIDKWWDERSSTTSHSKIARLILKDNKNMMMDTTTTNHHHKSCGCCLGIEGTDGRLRACILRYEGGAIGMLHVDEPYRRLGYGQALLNEVTLRLEKENMECVAFIVDGNDASETLFRKMNWERDDPTMKRKTGRRKAKRKWIKKCI